MVEDVYEQLKIAASERKIVLILEGDFPVIKVDELLFKEAVQNIMANSFKFTKNKEEAIIRITVADDGDNYRLVFADNGVGFNMKYKDKLFKIFQRLHKNTDFEGAGAGLTL